MPVTWTQIDVGGDTDPGTESDAGVEPADDGQYGI
jgi:hypothetical protein